jgi:hypothetical protein
LKIGGGEEPQMTSKRWRFSGLTRFETAGTNKGKDIGKDIGRAIWIEYT